MVLNKPFYGNFQGFIIQHNRQSQANLNTPVVALQTPIPGLSNYPLNSFGAQDFSLNNTDINMITSWNTHQSISTLQHTR